LDLVTLVKIYSNLINSLINVDEIAVKSAKIMN
jgi:hypothetical protein